MVDTIARVLFDENGNAIKVTQDGSDYKYEFLGKLRNAAGAVVNPATEDTLSAIDGVLDSIKDTDGIKKIADELPAGTQEIGAVAQGTPAEAANAWSVVRCAANGGELKIYETGGERIPAAQSLTTNALLEDIKTELRRLNMHMRILTEMDIKDIDMDDEGTLL